MSSPGIKILVVEDEALIAMDICEKLTDMGYEVLKTADNGADAIKYADELKPDIVLMDIVIKGKMDGIEAAEIIWETFSIPSLFLTAYNSDSVIQRARKFNPVDFLLKPFDDNKLQEAILEMNIQGAISARQK
ncbi:MAG: response regulator [Ignavibacteria bacterium]|nr:response regulator [Ignavibacteria bacterium]